MLEIDPGTVCYIVLKARQVYAPEDTVEENIGANPVDEEALEALAANERPFGVGQSQRSSCG